MALLTSRQIELKHHTGRRLDRSIKSELPGLPKSAIYKMLRKGKFKINRKKSCPGQIVLQGDVLHIFGKVDIPTLPTQPQLPDHKFHILFENRDLLVISKEPGLPVHKGSGHKFGAIELLAQQREHPVLPLHRIDKDASGCLAMAKNSKTALYFRDLLLKRKVLKKYYVLVQGRMKNVKRISVPLDNKESITFIENAHYIRNFSALTIQIETGRKHQIRRHLASLGHPVVGDVLYGSKYVKSRIFLHAYSLTFSLGKKLYNFHSPLPSEWRQFTNKKHHHVTEEY